MTARRTISEADTWEPPLIPAVSPLVCWTNGAVVATLLGTQLGKFGISGDMGNFFGKFGISGDMGNLGSVETSLLHYWHKWSPDQHYR
jgi:hypothetical protein